MRNTRRRRPRRGSIPRIRGAVVFIGGRAQASCIPRRRLSVRSTGLRVFLGDVPVKDTGLPVFVGGEILEEDLGGVTHDYEYSLQERHRLWSITRRHSTGLRERERHL